MSAATSRRTLVKGVAWSVPVVSMAATAPAFAASALGCTPTAYKKPGRGKNRKDYVLRPGCNYDVTCVWIDGKAATRRADGTWIVSDQPNSRAKLTVIIQTPNGRWGPTLVAFPPGEDPQ